MIGALGPNMKLKILNSDAELQRFKEWAPSKSHYVLVSNKDQIAPFYQVLPRSPLSSTSSLLSFVLFSSQFQFIILLI